MVRPKMKLQRITNDSSRRAAFYKRKKGIMKKVRELSTLCDVKACLILYRPGNPRPEVWPSVPEAVRVISQMSEFPETVRRKKMLDQEGLVRQTIKKNTEHLQKQRNEIRDMKKDLLLYQCLDARSLSHATSIDEVTDIVELAEVKIKQLERRIGASSAMNDQEVVNCSEVLKVVVDKQEKAPSEVTMAAATYNTVQQEVIKTTEEPTKVAVEEKQPSKVVAKEEHRQGKEQKQQQEEQQSPQLGLMWSGQQMQFGQQQQQQFQQFGLTRSGQQRASGRQILIHPYAGDDTNQWMAWAYKSQFFFRNPYNPMN